MTTGPFWKRPLTLRIDGRALDHLRVASVDVRFAVNAIASVELALAASSDDFRHDWDQLSSDADRCQPGAHLVLSIGMDGSGDAVVLFDGFVAQQHLAWHSARPEMTLRAQHPLQKLLGPARSVVYEGKSDAEVLTALLQPHLKVGKMAALGAPHEQLVQWRSSDWQWLRSRLHAHGAWLVPHVNRVDCIMPKVAGTTHHRLYRDRTVPGQPAIESVEWRYSNETQPASVDVRYWDVAEQRLSAAAVGKPVDLGSQGLRPTAVKPLHAAPWTIFHAIPLTQGEAQAQADACLLAQHAAAICIDLALQGAPETVCYQLGETIELIGFGKRFSGRGLISAVRHRWRQGSFQTIVSIGQAASRPVDAAVLPRAPQITVGVVAKHRDDESNADRIRVRVPLLGSTLWARLAKPYASSGSGMQMYPDEGNEVVLAFIDDDPRFPVVLGATHNPVVRAPAVNGDRAHWKGWIAAMFGEDNDRKPIGINFSHDGVTVQTAGGVLALDAQHARLSLGEEAMTIENRQVTVQGATVQLTGGAIKLDKRD